MFLPRVAIILLGCAIGLECVSARADGGFVSPESRDIREPEQLGLIVFDGQREDLYLQVGYEEYEEQRVDRLGWILTTPSVPDAAEADPDLFVQLMNATRPYDDEEDPFEYGCASKMGQASDNRPGDLEIERQMVAGAYDITVVSAVETAPLRNWISKRGYSLHEDADPILEFYIEKKWHFLAIDVDLAEARADGMLKPLKLSFESAEPVFPLRISAINGMGKADEDDSDDDDYYDDTEILLYLVAGQPLTSTNYSEYLEFAQPFARSDFDSYPAVQAAVPGKGSLIKLRYWLSTEEMVDDMEFAPRARSAPMAATAGMASSPRRSRSVHGLLLAALFAIALIRKVRVS